MNTLVNRVQLIGSLGKDPEVKTFDNGKKLARFSIATNENYKNAQGEKVTETTWHNVVAWGKLTDIIEKYVSKGDRICLEGKLTNNHYTDKDGNKRYAVEIVANELLMLNNKKS